MHKLQSTYKWTELLLPFFPQTTRFLGIPCGEAEPVQTSGCPAHSPTRKELQTETSIKTREQRSSFCQLPVSLCLIRPVWISGRRVQECPSHIRLLSHPEDGEVIQDSCGSAKASAHPKESAHIFFFFFNVKNMTVMRVVKLSNLTLKLSNI